MYIKELQIFQKVSISKTHYVKMVCCILNCNIYTHIEFIMNSETESDT